MTKGSSLKLNTGKTIPACGLGTWLSKQDKVGAAVEIALKAGYRHLDCAHIYGNEAEIGEALQKCFKGGVCKREDVFISSKLWSGDTDKQYVLPAIQLTLKNLQLEYLDLYVIHGPMSIRHGVDLQSIRDEDKLGYDEARFARVWEGMEDVLSKGLTHAIGVANFSITKLDALLKTAKVVPAVNYVETHLYFQQKKMQAYCKKKGILIEAQGPLGSPGRYDAKSTDPVVLDDPAVKEIAKKKGATPAQICISFLLHCGLVVIPRSVTERRITENIEATKISLDDSEVKKLEDRDKNFRLFYNVSTWLPKGMTTEEAFDVEKDEKFVL